MKDKHKLALGILFLFVGIVSFNLFLIPGIAQTWNSCPFGLENDPYPGECGRYVDSNNDGICDLSQPNPEKTEGTLSGEKIEEGLPDKSTSTFDISEEEYSVEISGSRLKNMTIKEVAQLWGIEASQLLNKLKIGLLLEKDYTIENTIDDLRKEIHFSPSIVKRVAEDLKRQNSLSVELSREERVINYTQSNTNNPNSNSINQAITPDVQDKTVKQKIIAHYNFMEIALLTLLAYLLGKWLTARLKINSAKEKKFWNVLLLVSFIASAGTGFILVFIRDFGWFRQVNFNFLFWHVEYSIVMGFIGIFHALWHVKYYFKIFFKKR